MLFVAIREKRITSPVILLVDPDVICWESTNFSNINATNNIAAIGDDLPSFESIELNLATRKYNYNKHTPEEKKLIQAEVLIKEHLPLKYII